MAALKDELDASAGRHLARELTAAWPAFPHRRFTRGLAAVLEPLELLARSDALAERLVQDLPTPFDEAAGVLRRALESPSFDGWIVMPCGGFVARAGLDEPAVALPLLAGLTSRWSSEFAIRSFIEHRREPAYEHLRRWVLDEDEHVRRLVSEGTRPRLPWARQLRFLVEDPCPNLPLLEGLVEDPSPYVRRSVANHLNDISKDHRGLALELAADWIRRGSAAEALVRHGLRTLIKRGDRDALALVGAGDDRVELVSLTVDRDRIGIGETVELCASLALTEGADTSTEVIVDYRVHYIGANGEPKAPKVFKLARRRIEPGRPITVRRRHAFEHVSIRRIQPGAHRIDIQVNGTVLGHVSIDVGMSPSAGRSRGR
jgi:3-methyladenine DNA glycosylase AlkC